MKRFVLAVAFGFALSSAACARGAASEEPPVAPRAEADIVIDPATRFQTLDGWEVTLRGWEEDKKADRYDPSFSAARAEAVKRLVEDAGVNRVRLQISSATEAKEDYWRRFVDGKETYASWSQIRYANANDNGDPMVANPAGFHWTAFDEDVEGFVLPMRSALAARGEKLFVNICVVDFGNLRRGQRDPGALDLAAHPQEYAELVVETFRRLKNKYGVTPDALELMLEPENGQGWTPQKLAAAAKATKKRLAAEGFTPQIIGPSTVRAKNAIRYFDALEKAGVDVDVLSYHSYDRPDDALRRAIRARATKAGATTAMLEHLKANAQEFYADMTEANVSAWQQWAIAGRVDNGNYLFVGDPSAKIGEQLSFGRRTAFLAQIWRHARIGDQRVAATSDDPGVKPLAFVKPDGGVVVTAIIDTPKAITLTGLPPGDYAMEMTTGRAFAQSNGTVAVGADGRARLDLKSKGVIALFPATE